MSNVSKEKFTTALGKRIKQERENKGMSQEELSHKAGLYRTYIGHLEVGRYSPSAFIVFKISKALNVDPAKLFPN
jgi:transcriptional regulator with XRE-family HTH domain